MTNFDLYIAGWGNRYPGLSAIEQAELTTAINNSAEGAVAFALGVIDRGSAAKSQTTLTTAITTTFTRPADQEAGYFNPYALTWARRQSVLINAPKPRPRDDVGRALVYEWYVIAVALGGADVSLKACNSFVTEMKRILA